MQAEMAKIYENEKFSLYVGSGSKNAGLISFCPADSRGMAINDTFSVSSEPCTLSDFSGEVRKYAAWQDIGKGHTRPGAKAMIWDGPCQHWCACTNRRATAVTYIMTGKVYIPTKGATAVLMVGAGDYIAVVKGHIKSDDGTEYKNLYVSEADAAQRIKITAITDSVVFVLTATPI